MKTRLLSIALALCMALSLTPVAYATEGDTGASGDGGETTPAATCVATIGDEQYETLAAAFDDAQSGVTIKLQSNVELSNPIEVSKTVTLDLNGKTIETANSAETRGLAFNLGQEGCQFTIDDTGNGGTIKSNYQDNGNVIQVSSGELVVKGGNITNNWYVIFVSQSGTATVQGGTLTSQVASVLSTNGSAQGEEEYSGRAIMNVEGGNLTSANDVAIYVPAGTLNVSDGAIKGATAIYAKSGTTNITGGTVSSEAEKAEFKHQPGGCLPTGDAMVIEACDYPNGEPVVKISGGTFSSANADAVAYYQYNGHAAQEITITGGTFTSNVSDWVPEGYSCLPNGENGAYVVKELTDGQMAIENVSTEESVSAVLDGRYNGNDTDIESGSDSDPSGSAENGNVTIDLTTDQGNVEAKGATLTVTSTAAQSLAENNATSLTIETDLGTVSFDADVLKKMGADGVNSDVAISIKNEGETAASGFKAAYTIEATSNGQNLLPYGGADNGTVTITVPRPDGVTSPQAWYAVNSNDSWVCVDPLDCTPNGNNLVIEIGHLSTIVVTEGDPENAAVAEVVKDDTTTYFTSLDDALGKVTTDGGTINLRQNATMTKGVTISSNVTINGNGHTITGVAENAGVNFTVSSGTFSISNVKLDGFGSSAGTGSGIAVIKVNDNADAKVVANDVNISNFCRSAYDIRSGSFEITGGTIDCGGVTTGGSNTRLTKGIMAGLGSSQVTGTISGVTIKNSASNYDEWSSGGIEVYQNANVTISDCTITDVENGISVDNYYAASGSGTTGATVKVENTNVNATNDAVRVYGSSNQQNVSTTATVTVDGGSYSGDIAIINGATESESSAAKEAITVTNAEIQGTIDNANGVISFVNCAITEADGDTDKKEGVTYVNTAINGGDPFTTTTENKEALLNGKTYDTLEDAVTAARAGDTITLLANVELDGTGKVNTEGVLTIEKDLVIEGNGKIITAKNVTTSGDSGPSMINVENGANVVIRNLVINGEGGAEGKENNTKHGLNVYGDGTSITVENVTAKNGNGYGIVVNGAQAIINGLTTLNNGWGGINVDSKSGAASLTVNNANIGEPNSIKIENGASSANKDPEVVITGGTFNYVTKGGEITEPNLSISGGKFATGSGPENAVDISDYVEEGLTWNPVTGVVSDSTSAPGTGGGGGTAVPSFDITVAQPADGTIAVEPTSAKEGDEVTVTVTPDEGFELSELTVTDEDGNELELTANADGTYSFEMPAGKVSVSATFVCDGGALCPSHGFTDVDQSQWYHAAIDWAVTEGVMHGIGGTTLFDPNGDLTREQAATVMWNGWAQGDLAAPAVALTDVDQAQWYAPYVNWAVKAAVMQGYGGTDRFGVGDALTREQFAMVIANATEANLSGADTSVLEGFNDPESVSDWATPVMAWAVESGVINGVALPDGTFDLQGSREVTRAEMAMMVMNAVEEGILEL